MKVPGSWSCNGESAAASCSGDQECHGGVFEFGEETSGSTQ